MAAWITANRESLQSLKSAQLMTGGIPFDYALKPCIDCKTGRDFAKNFERQFGRLPGAFDKLTEQRKTNNRIKARLAENLAERMSAMDG